MSKNTDATFAMCFFFLATSQYLSPEGGVGSVAFFLFLLEEGHVVSIGNGVDISRR